MGGWDDVMKKAKEEAKAKKFDQPITTAFVIVAFAVIVVVLIFSIWAFTVVRRCRRFFNELATQREPLVRYQSERES